MSEYKLSDRIRSGTDIMQRIVGGQRSALIELSDEVAALESKLKRMKRDRNYVVTWLYANINDPGLLKHFERARKLASAQGDDGN